MNLSTYISLFPGASREKPHFIALAEAVLRQVMDLQALVADLPSCFSLEEARGVQLDAFGEALGVRREDAGQNASDTAYRRYILSKLALWCWDGTNGTVKDILEEALPGRTETENQDGTVTVSQPGRKELLPVSAGMRVNVL